MKKSIIYFTMVAMILCSCNKKAQMPVDTGINWANLDTTAVPGNDFYQYADGGWMLLHPLTPEHARFGTFDLLREESQNQVKELIAEISQKENAQGTVAQKIGDFYALAMDSVRLNKEGAAPLLPELEKVNKIADKKELTAVLVDLFHDGIFPFFQPYVDADEMNSNLNVFKIFQGGYNLGDRDYYLENDAKTQEIRAKYVELIKKQFTLAGFTAEGAKTASAAVMKIETQLAKVASAREALRDPMANYHKMTVVQLAKHSPEIDWVNLFSALGLKDLKDLIVGQTAPISEVSKIIKAEPLDNIKYYLSWNVIHTAAGYLSDDFSDASFEFYGKILSGKEKQQERWKRAVRMLDGSLGEAVGQLYVEKYFPPAAKEKMMGLVQNLKTALSERINGLEWMSTETKVKAQEKLGTFHVKIGYPDRWRDYSKLAIDKKDSYFTNILRSNNFDVEYMISKCNKPVDKDEWLMTPQTVNAYYNPSTNEICFPAGILQPPFFNFDADDAVNYGAIGVVIGHEMTHGFDDQGRQFDKDGNLKDWWTKEDADRFKERAQVLVDVFDNIIVIDSVHANGRYTLGENIADQGGLQVSWQAYQNTLKDKPVPAPIDGFSNAQRFFLGYATVWASNIRPEEILHLTKSDPHSLGRWRVNGALPQIDAWYDAFNVTPANTMYVPKEKRVAIW